MGPMKWLGKLVAAPIRIVNAPARAMEKFFASSMGDDDIPKDERIMSAPLGLLGDAIEEAISGEDD